MSIMQKQDGEDIVWVAKDRRYNRGQEVELLRLGQSADGVGQVTIAADVTFSGDTGGDTPLASDIPLVDSLSIITATQVEAGFAELSKRFLGAFATEAAIKALAAAKRSDGALAVDLTASVLWVFDADSAATASAFVLVPDVGSGRWLRQTVRPTEIAIVSTVVGAEGAVAANAIEVAVTLKDLAGTVITDQRKMQVRSHAVTPDKGDIAAAGTPVGTLDQAINPTTGANVAIFTPTIGGLFSFRISDDVAEKVLVEILGEGVRPSVLLLTFA